MPTSNFARAIAAMEANVNRLERHVLWQGGTRTKRPSGPAGCKRPKRVSRKNIPLILRLQRHPVYRCATCITTTPFYRLISFGFELLEGHNSSASVHRCHCSPYRLRSLQPSTQEEQQRRSFWPAFSSRCLSRREAAQ